ncbi:MAG TPA: suppressor of fused domain protein [Allosphingosinicella sp.]|jgi:hypothetical protein
MTQDDPPEDAAPGWDAIDAALASLYPDQKPRHVAPFIRRILGGPDPLDGISAWKRDEPTPHWHFVSYGLTELYTKDWDDPERSGFGFELTFRLARDAAEDEPPMWPFSLLQNIARYVFESGNVIDDGHWMNANGPIARDNETSLRSLAFVTDPELGSIGTPHGRVAFIQIVGLTLDEEAAAKRWQTPRLLDTLLPHMPLWVTDLSRGSLIDRPDVKRQIEEGAAREGSSTGALFTEKLGWSAQKPFFRSAIIVVELGAGQVEELLLLLALRLPFGRELRLFGPETSIAFVPGAADSVAEEDGGLRVQLAPASVESIRAVLRPARGRYQVPGLEGLAWDVRPTLIRDASGAVVETIG